MRSRRLYVGILFACLALLSMGTVPARANRALLSEKAVLAGGSPSKQIEDACGIGIGPAGEIFVSDYHHRMIDVFNTGGSYVTQIPSGAAPEGPCGLATSPAGALYVNYYHQGVVRLEPSFLAFDPGNSTGVATDLNGNVYTNNRTYLAVYQPSAQALLFEGQPLRIGLGSLGDAYGLAVSSFPQTKGRVYVADAADNTIKVYEPATDRLNPSIVIDGAATPQGGFTSLVDAALAVDPTNGHLLVVDNLQPGYEHPQAAIDEFDSSGAFLGQLSKKIIDGEPSGLTVSGTGNLFATSGNDEEATVFRFGQYSPAGPEEAARLAGEGALTQQVTPAVGATLEASSAPAKQIATAAKKSHKKLKHRRRHRKARAAK